MAISFVLFIMFILLKSGYDQEIPQSHTVDQPTAPIIFLLDLLIKNILYFLKHDVPHKIFSTIQQVVDMALHCKLRHQF